MGVTFQIPPPAIPPLGAGLDYICCSVPLAPLNYATAFPTPADDPFHQLTALLNFLPHPIVRARLQTLAYASSTHHRTNALSIDPGLPFRSNLNLAPAGFGTAVLALPATPGSLPDPTAPRSALLTLRSSHHVITTVLAVAAQPRSWRAAGLNVDGWVQAGAGAEGSAAEHMFAVLGTLMSADTLTCVDEGMIADTLGSYERPARVAELMWLESERLLVWLRAPDHERASLAHTAIAFPLTASPLLASASALYVALRAALPATASLSISVCVSLPALPFSSPHAYPVALLYR
ncbi:MAG: hypothetical protein JWQ07_4463 [Ramlibacter sp.]|nr:hypothetical protein [Ramlibacter sp.]